MGPYSAMVHNGYVAMSWFQVTWRSMGLSNDL